MTVETLAKEHNWNMPTVCPICGAKLDITENEKGKATGPNSSQSQNWLLFIDVGLTKSVYVP